jgi:predicted MFS family arabinose efflux permease
MRPFGLWRRPDFLKLWTGQTISLFGTRLDALGYTAILVLGAGPIQLGVLAALEATPILVIGLVAGVWVDRVRRSPVMIAADLLRAAVFLSIPLAYAMGRLTLAQLILAGALVGLCTVFFDVAYQSFVPVLVSRRELVEANSKLGMSASLAEVTGPGLAGVLVQALSAPTTVFIDALTFLASALSLGLIRHREPPPEPPIVQADMRREIGEGLRAVLWHPILRALALAAGTNTFFGGFFGTLYVLYLIRVLGIGPAGVGLTIAAGGAGDLLGAICAPLIARRFGQGRTLLALGILIPISAILYPLAGGPATTATLILCLVQFIGDFGHAAYDIHELSIRQAIAPAQLLGRVNATSRVIGRGTYPFGLLAGGILGELVGIRTTIWIAIFGFFLASLWLIFSPLAAYDARPEAGPPHSG